MVSPSDSDPSRDDKAEDDFLDLDFDELDTEDVLDVESPESPPDDDKPSGDVSEVELLDFLDDDDDAESPPASAPPTAGIDVTTKFTAPLPGDSADTINETDAKDQALAESAESLDDHSDDLAEIDELTFEDFQFDETDETTEEPEDLDDIAQLPADDEAEESSSESSGEPPMPEAPDAPPASQVDETESAPNEEPAPQAAQFLDPNTPIDFVDPEGESLDDLADFTDDEQPLPSDSDDDIAPVAGTIGTDDDWQDIEPEGVEISTELVDFNADENPLVTPVDGATDEHAADASVDADSDSPAETASAEDESPLELTDFEDAADTSAESEPAAVSDDDVEDMFAGFDDSGSGDVTSRSEDEKSDSLEIESFELADSTEESPSAFFIADDADGETEPPAEQAEPLHIVDDIEESEAADAPLHLTGDEPEIILPQPEAPMFVGPEDEGEGDELVEPQGTITEAGEPPKKKSSLPMIAIGLVGVLAVAGGLIGGLYVGGMLPGFGPDDDQGQVTVNNNDPGVNLGTDDTGAPSSDLVAEQAATRIDKLLTSAVVPGGETPISIEKLDEAQAELDQLQAETPQAMDDPLIVETQARLADLRTKSNEEQRVINMRRFMGLAGAELPEVLNEEALAQAEALASTDLESAEIAALRDRHERYLAEQASAAADSAQRELLVKFPEVVSSPEEFATALTGYASALPDEARSTDFQAVAANDPAVLAQIYNWNNAVAQVASTDLRKVTPEMAAQWYATIAPQLDGATNLNGAAMMKDRTAALQSMAQRVNAEGMSIIEPLNQAFSLGADKVSFVLATKDGQRYYLIDKPQKEGAAYVGKYLASPDGTQNDFKIELANIDRANTGATTLAAQAKTLFDLLTAVDHTNWEPSFVKALLTIDADKKLDPVVKVVWLDAVLRVGATGSEPIRRQFEPLSAKLADTGIDQAFNWADPTAAAGVRDKCAAALAELPSLKEMAGRAAVAWRDLAPVEVPELMMPAGVLMRNDAGDWQVLAIDSAPNSANLFLVTAGDDDQYLAFNAIGQITDGNVSFSPDAQKEQFLEGRPVYAVAVE